ncbi:MAG TPA: hypothetical protein VNB06_01080 [Thermoanaerobaculia bacterium]|nr:hypothetical protein [Thermoanaerobaculia bacterium]
MPDLDAPSGLSPYLHFGHISAHQVFFDLMRREGWTPDRVSDRTDGSRSGFWGLGESAEGFLDQLVTWRELGYNFCVHRPDDYDRYSSLPDWAQRTLAKHAGDPRTPRYSTEQLENAETADRSGTPPRTSSVATVESTTTCACCGALRSAVALRMS